MNAPFSIRLRLAAGLRVPTKYREWALRQIQSEGWPVRQAITRLVLLYPAALLGVGTTLLFFRGSGRSIGLLMGLVVFPLMAVVVGIVMGAGWPEWVRHRAIAYQLKEKGP